MISADRNSVIVIAGTIFAGYIGWKLIQCLCEKKHVITIKRRMDEPIRKSTNSATWAEKKKHFLELLRSGEQCLVAGKYDEGIDHLINAMIFCNNNENLRGVLKNSLPKPLYDEFHRTLEAKIKAQKRENGRKDVAAEEKFNW